MSSTIRLVVSRIPGAATSREALSDLARVLVRSSITLGSADLVSALADVQAQGVLPVPASWGRARRARLVDAAKAVRIELGRASYRELAAFTA
jgi:hypothetical protein